jgi:virulence factor Mce-like protein
VSRRLVIGPLVVLLALAAGWLLGGGALLGRVQESASSKLSGVENTTYRVDAEFDTAKGVLPGQVVKIAGARAGTIEDVALTPHYKALVRMRVDRRFAPFRSDARCAIQPEAIIGERFVQCDPGSPEGRPLRAPRGADAPTVPVARTSAPVGLTDLFQIFNAPTRQRVPLVVATLGLGVAGRGDDLNALVRRANPTLAQVHAVLTRIHRQRRELADTVVATDRVVAELARRRGRVTEFLDRAARVTDATAGRRGELEQTIRRLPPLLDAAEPALVRTTALARAGTPLLGELRTAAPELERLLVRAQPFARNALPTLTTLQRTVPRGRRAVRAATPVVRQLRSFTRVALPAGAQLADLTVDLRDSGSVERLLTVVYRLSTSMARFDTVSHLFPIVLNLSTCSVVAETTSADCNGNYASRGGPSAARAAEPPPAPGPGEPLLDFLLR